MRRAKNSNAILCPLCLDILTAPRSLPCLHTYCEKCLGDFIRKSVKKDDEKKLFKCPTCETETLAPSCDVPVENWAEHYPYDHIMQLFLPEDKNKFDESCELCMKRGKTELATSFCTNCREAMCANCAAVHKISKVVTHHSLFNMDGTNEQSNVSVYLSTRLLCQCHPHRDIEYFCTFHESVCCPDCAVHDHRGCKELLKLKLHGDTLMSGKNSACLKKHIKDIVDHIDKFAKSNNTAILKIEKDTEHMVEEIEGLISLLHETKDRILKDRRELLEKESMIRHSENQHCNSLKAALNISHKVIEVVSKSGDCYEAFVVMHKVEDQIVHCKKILKEKYSDVRCVDSELRFDSHLIALRQIGERLLAKVTVKETKQKMPPLPRNYDSFRLINVGTIETASVRKTQKWVSRQRLLRSETELPHLYTGIECLSDNKIVLVDNGPVQGTCQVFDIQTRHFLADYQLPSSTFDVCVLDEGYPEIAVTLPAAEEIHVLSVQSTEYGTIMSAMKTINTHPWKCYGVRFLTSDLLVASVIQGNKLCWCFVSVAEGKVDKVHDICDNVKSLYTWSYLATSQDRSRIYISCYVDSDDSSTVYCFSVADGRRIFKYQHPDLTCPKRICVDRKDNVYISNCSNPGSIHQITDEGELIQVFKIRIPSLPLAICFNEKGKELFVTKCLESDIERLRLV